MEYRTLGPDEFIQDGDEFFSERWLPANLTIGCMVWYAKMNILNTEYRRPVSSEYRELEKGDVVKAGDEFLDVYSNKWRSVRFDIGNVVDRVINDTKYRRRISDTSGAVVATVAEMMWRKKTLAVDICVLCKANPLRNCPPCREIRQAVSANPPRLNPRRTQPSEPNIVVRKGWDNVTGKDGRIDYLHVDSYKILSPRPNAAISLIIAEMERIESEYAKTRSNL